MWVLGIDPGKVNVGIVLALCGNQTDKIEGDILDLEVKHAELTHYKNDDKFIDHLLYLMRTYSILPVDLRVVIEKQPHSGNISSNMRYVQGYMKGIGCTAYIRNPITYGLHIDSYIERKKFSLQLATDRVPKIYSGNVLVEVLQADTRKYDIADSFNLVYNEWCKITNHSTA